MQDSMRCRRNAWSFASLRMTTLFRMTGLLGGIQAAEVKLARASSFDFALPESSESVAS